MEYTVMEGLALPPNLVDEVRRHFRFTQAEAETVGALARGLSLSAYAEERGVSLNTVRTLLKRAMAKAGCNRQAQLVALILSGRSAA